MSGVNKAVIVGNLGQNPEVRTLDNGTKVVTLSVATSESWKDKNSGEKKERTEWHRVVIFGNGENGGLAGVAEKYLRKGSKVYLEGSIRTRKYQKDGTDHYTTEIVLQGFGSDLQLLDRSEGGNRPPPANSSDDYGRESSRPTADRQDQGGADDDSIPF